MKSDCKAALDARRDGFAIHENGLFLPMDQTRRVSSDAEPRVGGARVEQLEHRIQVLHDRVNSLEKSLVPDNSQDRRTIANGRDHAGHDLRNRIGVLEHRFSDTSSKRPERPQTLIPPLAAHLKTSSGGAKVFGPIHWAHAFQEVCIPQHQTAWLPHH